MDIESGYELGEVFYRGACRTEAFLRVSETVSRLYGLPIEGDVQVPNRSVEQVGEGGELVSLVLGQTVIMEGPVHDFHDAGKAIVVGVGQEINPGTEECREVSLGHGGGVERVDEFFPCRRDGLGQMMVCASNSGHERENGIGERRQCIIFVGGWPGVRRGAGSFLASRLLSASLRGSVGGRTRSRATTG